jgi:hypothetical protein
MTGKQYAALRQEMQRVIESHGLTACLLAAVEIAYGKANHAEDVAKDRNQAASWNAIATAFDKVALWTGEHGL